MLKWNKKIGMGNEYEHCKTALFCEVARYGSFSEAARRLYTAQPNLSKQIAQMEQGAGRCSVHPVLAARSKLTPAGQFLYDQTDQDLPDQLDNIFEQGPFPLARKRRGRQSVCLRDRMSIRYCLIDSVRDKDDLSAARSPWNAIPIRISEAAHVPAL